MPTLADYLFVLFLIVVMSIVEHVVFWPWFRAAVTSDRKRARTHGYQWAVAGQLTFGCAVMAIWLTAGRPLADLWLTPPGGWRLVLSAGIVAAMGWFSSLQLRAIARTSPERRVALRPKLGAVAFMLPRTRLEQRWFMALSLAAGICEELVYRGYLVWVLSRWIGTIGAALAVVALFGIAHAYQGRKGFTRATLAGAVMGGIVLGTQWIVPAMIVHVLIDAMSGLVSYTILRTNGADGDKAVAGRSEPAFPGAAPA
jgi:CAAX protease family protein